MTDHVRVLTGDRPTGPLHLGHYFGTLRNRVRLQQSGIELIVVIAGYQVLTDRDVADRLAPTVDGLVLEYLAAGLEPERTTIFTHSAVPALNQLVLPFLSLVSVPELQRNPTVKDELTHSRQSSVSGLMFTCPVHQAADQDPHEVAAAIGDAGAAALKQVVTAAANDFLAPMRARRAEYAQDPELVRKVLRTGNARANEMADETLEEVREAMGTRY